MLPAVDRGHEHGVLLDGGRRLRGRRLERREIAQPRVDVGRRGDAARSASRPARRRRAEPAERLDRRRAPLVAHVGGHAEGEQPLDGEGVRANISSEPRWARAPGGRPGGEDRRAAVVLEQQRLDDADTRAAPSNAARIRGRPRCAVSISGDQPP